MRYIVMIVLLLSWVGYSYAQDDVTSLTLTDVYYALNTVDDLESRDVLTDSDATVQRDYYLDIGATIAGEPITRLELESRLFDDPSWWRFLSFVNIIWVFASIIIILSASLLFVRYVVPILKLIPITVYEILLYLICIGFIYGGQFVTANASQFVALPGIFGLAMLLPFSYQRRLPDDVKKLTYDDVKLPIIAQNAILTVVWGATAIGYQSQLIGFLTVVVFVATIAATRAIPALLNSIGFTDDSIGREVIVTSLLLLLTYIVLEVREVVGIYWVFEVGIHWIGAYGFFGGLTWMSSRIRQSKSQSGYIFWQVASVISGVGAILVGQLFDIGALTEVGGTFLLFYILGKYIEASNWREYRLWAALGLGILLYIIALVINQYPEFFLFG